MPFIGKNPNAGFATIVKDTLTADGSTTQFTLSKQVASATDIAVFVGNVRQEPTTAYTVNGTTLDFGSGNAPATGLDMYVLHIGGTQETSIVPADGTISSAKIQSSAITDAKIAGMASSKLTGALPAVSGASLTSLPNGNLIQVATKTRTSSDTSGSFDIPNCFTSTYNDYVIDYKLTSTVANVNTVNFALETSGADVESSGIYPSSLSSWASTTFETEIEYWLIGQGTNGSVRAAASTYAFLGANTNTNNASTYFEGRLWMKNVYSGTGFMYWAEHYMHNPNEYWEMPKGAATTGAAVNARGIRFFSEPGATNYGEASSLLNTTGEVTIYGVVGS